MAAKTDIKKTSLVLAAITVLMFGFGYALVPLYNVFCEITGLNGNKAISVVSETESSEKAHDRWIDVQFHSNVNGDLPWRMKAKQINMKVQPGKFYEATFTVENMITNDVVGQAIPSVSPSQASLYFKKSECFCFVNQLLKAKETKEMVVRFEVDKDLPEAVEVITLSYTFFRAKTGNS